MEGQVQGCFYQSANLRPERFAPAVCLSRPEQATGKWLTPMSFHNRHLAQTLQRRFDRVGGEE